MTSSWKYWPAYLVRRSVTHAGKACSTLAMISVSHPKTGSPLMAVIRSPTATICVRITGVGSRCRGGILGSKMDKKHACPPEQRHEVRAPTERNGEAEGGGSYDIPSFVRRPRKCWTRRSLARARAKGKCVEMEKSIPTEPFSTVVRQRQ